MPETEQKPAKIQPSEVDTETTPKASKRFVAKSVRGLVKWAPSGLAGFPFLSFMLHQEWAQALMLFPVNVITTVWATYSNNFVDTLEEIYAERGKQDARSLVQFLDNANEAMQWQFSRFEQKYLKLQAERCCEYYGTDDARQPEGILQVDLEDVFVPLRMDFSMGEMGRRGKQQSIEDGEESLEIWDVLTRSQKVDSYKKVAILASGGSGKTTMLRHLSYRYGKGNVRFGVPKLVPFLLYLRQWRGTIAENPTMTLPELMERFVRDLRGWKTVKLPPNWAENLLNQGRALILFDGFDEVAEEQRSIVAQWVCDAMAAYPEARFVLTSRPGGYDAYKEHAAEVPMTLLVREFSKTERDTFVRKWYVAQSRVRRGGKLSAEATDRANRGAENLIDQIDEAEELQRMAVNPLLLNMLARLHYFRPEEALPQRRTELYQEICDLQLGARPAAKKIVMLLSKPQKRQQVLQGAALKMVRENIVQVPYDTMIDLMQEPLAELDVGADVAVFLQQITQVSELLYESVLGEYAFAHLSFRNYLAALEIERLGHEDTLIDHFDADWWRETILLYSVQCEPDALHQLVRRACKGNSENVYLAYDCLLRYPNQEKVDRAWIEALSS
jgi:predicted NACHT family NTPase